MKAKFTIKNSDSTNVIIFDDIKDKQFFSSLCGDEEYFVDLRENFVFEMRATDHTTKVTINRNGDSNIKISDNNGSILLPIKVLAINENNGMISLVYMIDDKENLIEIEYI